MNQKNVWGEYASLPSEAQEQVADFIALLRRRYGSPSRDSQAQQTDLAHEPFVGIWQDREDMQDSSKWVQSVRRREWS